MNKKFIELCLEVYHIEMPDTKLYQSHYFYTEENYSHEKLEKIMKSINQNVVINNTTGFVAVDLKDLVKQLTLYNIYEFITVERYFFNIE